MARRRRGRPVDGILVLDKPQGLSSNQALQKAKVTSELVRVKNGDHGYRPNPRDAVISPTRAQIEQREFAWFAKHLVRVTPKTQTKKKP